MLIFDVNDKKLTKLRSQKYKLQKKQEKSTSDKQKIQQLTQQIWQQQVRQNKLQNKIINDIRLSIKPYTSDNNKIVLGGLSIIISNIVDYIKKDLIVFSFIVILCMAIVLFIIFRLWACVIITIFISFFSSLIMTGIISALGWKITVISANFFSLLMVMTISIVIHLLVKSKELSENNIDNSIQIAIREMFKPCFLTALTTIIAFLSLLFSGIRPVIDFGLIMVIGTIVALIFSFIFYPCISTLYPSNFKSLKVKKNIIIDFLAKLVHHFGNSLMVFFIIMIIVLSFGLTKLSVENRFIDYFKKDTEIYQGLELIDKKLGGSIDVNIIINNMAQDYWYDEFIRNDIAKIHRFLENTSGMGKVLSIQTTVDLLNQINGKPVSQFFLNIVKNSLPDYVKTNLITPYLSEKNNQIRINARVKETTVGLNKTQLIADIKNFLKNELKLKEGKDFKVTGVLVLYNNMLASLFKSQISTIGTVFIMIFIMFTIIFRSFLVAIIALIPNLFPSLLILGIMGYFSITLDLMTITIAAITIGIGIDNAIHYIYRFKKELRVDGDYLLSIYRTHQSIGRALLYTSCTVAVGFSVLVFSNFIPSITFGVLTSVAMLVAFLSNMTILPKLLLILKPKLK